MAFRSNFFIKLLALLTLFIFSDCEPTLNNTSNLVDWIPQNTTVVIQINDLQTLENGLINNPILKSLPANLPLSKDQLFGLNQKEVTPQLISLTPYGKSENALSVVYQAALDSSYLSLPTVDYSGQKIYLDKRQQKTIYTAFVDGYTLHSNTQIVLENCIRNFEQKAKGISSDSFYELVKTADRQAPFNLHIKGDAPGINKDHWPSLPVFPKLGEDWVTYDVNLTKNGLSIDGLTKVIDSLGYPIGLLHGSDPKKSQLNQVIPQTVKSFLAIPLDNIQTLNDQFKKWVLYHNHPLKSTDLGLLKSVDEIGILRVKENTSAVFHLRNEEMAAAAFLPEIGEKTYRNISYYPSTLPKSLVVFLSIFSNKTEMKWISKVDDFLLLSPTEADLKILIAAYKDGKNLSNTLAFQQFSEDILAEKNSLLWLANNQQLKNNNANSSFWKKIDDQDFPYLAFQGNIENDFLHLHYRFHKASSEIQESTTNNVAVLALENPVATQPQWLKNHRTKQKDIVVQDETNVLYLFSNSGKLFWKKQLSGRIKGEIQQVDLYKNGRLQMAFNTEDRFMILDRNGKIVSPFNKKMRFSGPVQPLAVFDYDLRRNYRFLVAQGKNLAMYDGKGKKVSGFKLNKTSSNISEVPKHIRIGNKDFIVIKESSGKIQLLNRTGKPRVKLKEAVQFSDQQVYAYLKTFATTDKEGQFIQIDTKGNVVRSDLGLDKKHAITATSKSLVSLSENILTIKGIPVSLPYGVYSDPKIFYLNNTIYVSITNIEDEKVYLYLSDGQLVNGFPVYGTSAIDLANADKDKGLEFVVQSESNELLIYEIN